MHETNIKEKIRSGEFSSNTACLKKGFLQCNIVILSKENAADFYEFCQLNPKPCPLIAMSEPGSPYLPQLGDIDIRVDLPSYRIFENGIIRSDETDITDFWREDFITFAIGCSFSFDDILEEKGLEIRHNSDAGNISMYITNLICKPAGQFKSNLVVSMRPFKPADAITAIECSSQLPFAHGAPIHFGYPKEIGVENISLPDYGSPTKILEKEVPIFWACGVTPQLALLSAKPKIAITHTPGCMLITDIETKTLIKKKLPLRL